ncbi:MAG: single-stranded DNA-binding protein [Thermanaerothrix sp.]|nr:single-stranded DNA-binding protein [Thermanaerothrix sp.]
MYHKIIIVGNLGRDPEMRFAANGQPVTSFSVASNRRYTSADGQTITETIWFRITVWGKQAEACSQYLRQGSRVLVEGTLVPDTATGGPRMFQRRDGTTGASFEVRAQTVKFLSAKGETAEGIIPDTELVEGSEGEDGIPF